MFIDYEFVDGDEAESMPLPAKYVVCDRCEGTGTHDCWEGGMTGDEMAEQRPEFFEDYRAGVYDRTCTECNGNRVLLVVDRDKLLILGVLARFNASENVRERWAAEMAAESRWGF